MTGQGLADPKRLEALRATGLLDSPADAAFDRLTRLAARVLDVPVALVTLVDKDRQFFKSCVGLPEPWATRRQTPLSHSFCQHTITTGEPLVISDARENPLVRDNLAIPDLSVIAYAGIPLRTSEGHLIGTFCAIDSKPKQWTDSQLASLEDIATAVATEIELRAALENARQSGRELEMIAEAGQALAGSLEISEILEVIARIAVPVIADISMVDLLEDGKFRRVAGSSVDPELSELFARARAHPPSPGDGGPQDQAITTGAYVLVPEVEDQWTARVARNAEHRDLIERMKLGAVLVVPLKQRDGISVGAIAFVRVRGREPFEGRDLELAQELARRASMALDKALLYESARAATKARDEMMGVVSHDLRNPIHTIFMSASFLLDLLPQERSLERTQAAVIKRAAERANRLIGDLLDVTHLESGRFKLDVRPADPCAIVDETVQHAAGAALAAGITLTRGVVQPAAITVDADRVVQALGNIVTNAIKFTPPGGTVTISATQDGGSTEFVVSDTGDGIPSDQIPRLFDRYWQASRKDRRGVGLGLSIVKGIADAHGGRVHVESAPGQGSTFRLEFPG